MTNTPSPARKAAVDMLDQVIEMGRPLSESRVLEALAPADRAAAQRLATETLRGMERADRLLSKHMRKKAVPRVMNILRLGTYELCAGGAAHGVVSDCVEIASARKDTQSSKGLINAVLRKIADEGPEAWSKQRFPRLPRWLRDPLVEAWGPQAVANMERVHFEGAPLDLTPKGDGAVLAERLGGELLPTGSVRLRDAGQVSALAGFDTGEWWVQDVAAALPAKLLGDVKGLNVLDMCAAPGGKTLQLAAAGANVTALDLSGARLARVQENLDRTGLKATLVEGDALEHQGEYDAILLDAPCSATGTIRRHPDLPHAHEGEKISELIGLQEAMLEHALHLLRPGGRLVFATCSLIPDEGECHIDEILARHPGIETVPLSFDWIEENWRSEEGGLRLRPDYWAARGGMDGFYMAALHKL
ncbi:RsmB/NOP family class I SAM-dependent RNA methyltransferase [Tropicibacter naphthalenivorans]|uniref:Ribosomal RNA small subunit methyltransferase B n=1 Tax=Tropicibacter naphthalenivorans TaxID=441103 RepID=A0A0P1G147_9RHOB|nr:RsmB/NOP family class I SAM-dependent RNA methyltransferase [Tropicibacter naphthalenivorans]CUH75482.1 Ribosomal RNA small subunit methyltransferase B [Tropicibacter naphthalenivorans]SMC44222.1 16S rRNA (cytosine967-C5)-methyltransferase [Tropicibacter naphthalenivorans]